MHAAVHGGSKRGRLGRAVLATLVSANASRTFVSVTTPFHSMSSHITLTQNDKGKRVMSATGETIGDVVEIHGRRSFVDPDTGLEETNLERVGPNHRHDEETIRLYEEQIDEVTENEIVLSEPSTAD